jgi:CO/xanthine dehydrogenase FAD-binding subunit
MNSFNYYRPQSLEQTLDLLKHYGDKARLLAGGTDLLVRLKTGRYQPEVVIDIKGLTELDGGIRKDGNMIRIGALTVMATLEENALIQAHFLALAEAVASVGSVQIRNRATLAGNLCNASPAADTAPALLIYGARVKLLSAHGVREMTLSEFITGPGQTALSANEIVAEIALPLPEESEAAAFTRLTRRKGVDLATINICCQVFNSGRTRFAVGAAGPVPFVVEDHAGQLALSQGNKEQQAEIIRKLMEKASPITDIRASKEYRQAMLVVLGQRAYNKALERLNSSH